MTDRTDDLPDLAAEARQHPAATIDAIATGYDLVEAVPDPLLPAEETAVGCDAALEVLNRARRVTFLPTGDDMAPVLSKREEVRAIIEAARSSPDPVVITVRFEGPDLELRTLELIHRRRPRF